MAVAILLAWLAYSCLATSSRVTSNTTVSVPAAALLDLLYVTDQTCDDIEWCSFKKGNRTSDRIGPSSMRQWYGPCSCDVTCLTHGTCCPDFRLSKLMQGKVFTNVSEFASNILHNDTLYTADMSLHQEPHIDDVKQCVVSGLRVSETVPYDVPVPLPFYQMVTVCSITNISTTVKHKCEMRQNITQRPYMEDYLPVQSLVSGAVYRNKHCLLCSQEPDSQYEMWSVYFVSRKVHEFMLVDHVFEKVVVLAATLSGLLNVDLIFEPGKELKLRFPPQICFNFDVDTCAVDHETNNLLLDIACRSFTYPVFTKRPDKEMEPSVMFNNLACYHCNGGSYVEYGESCMYAEQIPFAVKMQFSGVERQKHDGLGVYLSRQCGKGRVFDAKKKACRDVFCPCGMMAENGSCVPVFEAVSSKIFKTYIHIKPQTYIHNTDVLIKYEQTLFQYFDEVFDVGSDFTLEHFLLYRSQDTSTGVEHALCIIFAGRETFVAFMDMLAYLTKTVREVKNIGHNGETFAFNMAIIDTFHFNIEYAVDETTGRMYIPVGGPFPRAIAIDIAIRIRECHFCYRVESLKDDVKRVGRSIVLKETGIKVVESMFSYLNYTERILLCMGKVLSISSNDSNDVHDKVEISSTSDRNVKITDKGNSEEKGMVGVVVFVFITMCIIGVWFWRKGQRNNLSRDSAKGQREIELSLAQVNENRDENEIETK